MKKRILIVAMLIILFHTGVSSPAAAAQNVEVTLPTFPVILNGCEMKPEYDAYPVIVYKDITYFPMTYRYGIFLGLATNWSGNTLTVDIKNTASQTLRWYEQKEKNRNKQIASIATSNIVVNGKTIYNGQEKYPLLLFRNITYFPLTWRFAVDEFGWDYTFDMEQGLQINSNFLGTEQTITTGNISVGFPQNSWNDEYKFIYQNGEHKKTFSLQTDLQEGIYYFNQQIDKNRYMKSSKNARIEDNTLFLPCVRQNDSTNLKENILLEINLEKGRVMNKTKMLIEAEIFY